MATFQQQKQQALRVFQSAIPVAQGVKQEAIVQRLKEAADHLAQGKLMVVVCGEFKQGKSSLINALLNEPGLFPVDVDVTTSLVSSITYGEAERITVALGEPGKEQTKQIQRAEIADYVTEQRNKGNQRRARMLIIEAPNQQLKDGLTLVDTPGVGGLNIRHTDVTYAFIPNADAILFVSDALRPLSNTDLKFIAERIAPHCQNLLFVVTRIDKNPDYPTVVADNRQKLAQVLGRSSDAITIVPVSNLAKLDYLESHDDEDLEISNYTALEGELWRLLREQRGRILLLGALGKLGQAIVEIKQPLQAEWEVCQQQDKQQADELERQFLETNQRLERLLNKNAQWLTQLSDGLTDIRVAVGEQYRSGFVRIRRQIDKYLDDASLLEQPDQIVNLLQADMYGRMSEVGKELGGQAAVLQAQLEASTGLNLNVFEPGPLLPEQPTPARIPQRTNKTGWWERAVDIARSARFGSMGGMFAAGSLGAVLGGAVGFLFGGIGAVPGAYIGGAIGSALGGVGGLATGARQGLSQLREKNKQQIARVIMPFFEDSQHDCDKALSEALRGLERSMRDDLRDQIQREKQTCERTLQSIQDARKLTQGQAAERAAELNVPLQRLSQIQKSVEALVRAAVEEGDGKAAGAEPAAEGMQEPGTEAEPKEAAPDADYGSFADE